MNITIIGLGLLGGSLAYALKGFRACRLTGFDIDGQTMQAALANGAIERAAQNIPQSLQGAELVILCVYPHSVIEIMQEYAGHLPPGCVITDICGVKTPLYQEIAALLPEGVDYVGIHPMAGKEVEGFANAEPGLFRGAGFIIVPLDGTKAESVELMHGLAAHIGATKIAVTNARTHDEIIAYTSGLMHVSAAALCMDFHPQTSGAFTAGAFRDCTRIANINPGMWSELLLMNKEPLLQQLDNFAQRLSQVRKALESGDKAALYALLERAGENKREMLKR
ncbi:MAG: prephenate dehydrogenase [Clostridiales bacterium]|nr:prephenate dehydrogenase [Clostridiales bacterium]